MKKKCKTYISKECFPTPLIQEGIVLLIDETKQTTIGTAKSAGKLKIIFREYIT